MDYVLIQKWYEQYQVDDRSKFDNIVSGMRREGLTEGKDVFSGGKTEKIVDYQMQTAACQYWVRGLPAVCKWWGYNKCTLKFEPDPITGKMPPMPTGYGPDGLCDSLGRREWCDYYEEGKPKDLTLFACVVPCIEKSGLGKRETSTTNTLMITPYTFDEIKGYNPNKKGVGRCDGWGMGRGPGPDDDPESDVVSRFEFIEDVYNEIAICRHYRPQQMGFGAVQPRPFHGSDTPGRPFNRNVNYIPQDDKALYDGSKADPLSKMDVRLPYIFLMYNAMAMYQKCAHWDGDLPAFFKVDYIGSDPSMFCIQMDGESRCKCTDSSCNDYKNIKEEWKEGLSWLLTGVWAPYGGIVCNGAKPECPCYSGRWIYCIDNRMRDGMSITADQMFELRFWTAYWSSQEEYDAFYLQKPGVTTEDGVADEATADIYTFSRWQGEVIDDPSSREMVGFRHHMCVPAPLNMREFDVDTYITKTRYVYPKLLVSTGTHAEGSVSFPTLVRELEIADAPELLIIYPYFSKNPWEFEPCSPPPPKDPCVHDSNLMTDPLISVIGKTVSKKIVYVINKTLTENSSEPIFDYMDQYVNASQIPGNKLREFSEAVESSLKVLAEEFTSLFNAESDIDGFFEVRRVTLKLNSLNELYAICKWKEASPPKYTFKKVKVKSVYWAGLIEQENAVHKHSGDVWYNYFPNFYYPSFSNIPGYVHTTTGKVQSVFSTYALYIYGIYADFALYSYCINEYIEEQDVNKWCHICGTRYIWGEIDDTEISYLWNFSIINATITYIPPTTTGDEVTTTTVIMCGDDVSGIELEVIYPNMPLASVSMDRENEIIRRAIPPNAFLLKSPKAYGFVNSEWKLNIKYAYQRLDTFMSDRVIWPYNMGAEWAWNKFATSPFQITHAKDENGFTITETGGLQSRGALKVMAFLADENDRVQAGVSTKFLLQGYNGGCRSVDIFYRYSAEAASFDLEPAYGFFTWRGSPTVNSNASPAVHSRTAKCGDHECAPGNCIGPMWFPFRNCTTVEFYNIQNGAAECTMPISEASPNLAVMGFAGWRYVMADKFNAWVTTGGNWASSCGTPWYYHYSMTSGGQRFVGYGNKKAKVDKWYYSFMGWALPPFGNKGRAFVERYLTRDFNSHIDFSYNPPKTSYRYMPMVFDKEDLFPDLNPFANPDEATPLHEPFSHFSMLSNYTAEFIAEKISEERYRFDEIIEPTYHGNCMYPHPVMGEGSMTRVIRYGFKYDECVWAWPDYWKSLERNFSGDGGDGGDGGGGEEESKLFTFLFLERPEYYFDYNKAEHRLITEEGQHTIEFKPPTKSSKNDGSIDDADSEVFPSISIDGKHRRYFRLLYKDYTPENIEWMDEVSSGESGGSDGGNIYELANNGKGLNGFSNLNNTGTQWLHDFNTLFDADASAEPNDERRAYMGKSFFTGKDVYLYYNRGLIATIMRNRLRYLPLDIDKDITPTDQEDIEGDIIHCSWELDPAADITGAPVCIRVSGSWGINGEKDSEGKSVKVIYSKPGIRVQEGLSDLVEVGFLESVTGRDISIVGLNKFTLEFELPRTPDRIVSKIAVFTADIIPYPTEKLKIESITADIGKYCEATEKIKVWEKKYYMGLAELPVSNADGADTKLYRTYDKDFINAGQYFPFEDKFATKIIDHDDGTFLDEDVTDFEEGGKVMSKLTMVGFNKIYREDEKLDITLSNLKEMELEPQRELHQEFFDQDDYDTLSFAGVAHPAVQKWLEEINAPMMQANGLTLTYEKIDWEHNEYKNLLNQNGEFITPGGHYFLWSDNFQRTRCYYFGGIMNVYKVGWVHEGHAHGGEGDGVESTWETSMSYVGWGRLHYYNGLFNVLGFLGQRDSISGQATGVVTQMNTDKYS